VVVVFFSVRDWAAWAPPMPPIDAPIPSLLRRRISPLGQHALRAVWSLAESSSCRVIGSSRHGEFGRTLSILDDLSDRAEISPADFTLSVHHALIGLLSIARDNRQGHTAIAAGDESFCCGLTEALGCLAETPDEPVILLHYDEPLPEPFLGFDTPGAAPEVLALVLAAEGPGIRLELAIDPSRPGGGVASSHATEFLKFLQTPERRDLVCAGERLHWHWRRCATEN
jgi:Beta-ketoacyl synthase, N-terminal domain